NKLLAEHPCFFDGAVVQRLSAPDSPGLALKRDSEEGKDSVLVLVNTDVDRSQQLTLSASTCEAYVRRAQVASQKSVRASAAGGGVDPVQRSGVVSPVTSSKTEFLKAQQKTGAQDGPGDLLGQPLPDFERRG